MSGIREVEGPTIATSHGNRSPSHLWHPIVCRIHDLVLQLIPRTASAVDELKLVLKMGQRTSTSIEKSGNVLDEDHPGKEGLQNTKEASKALGSGVFQTLPTGSSVLRRLREGLAWRPTCQDPQISLPYSEIPWPQHLRGRHNLRGLNQSPVRPVPLQSQPRDLIKLHTTKRLESRGFKPKVEPTRPRKGREHGH